jgi:type II secretory pathway predicted ATPase ExeA
VRPYVEHRLKHVGWSGEPIFALDSFAEIFAQTDGIPRRINLLCTRAMLAAFLQSRRTISASEIGKTATELGAELGEVPLRLAPKSAR